ncbi:MAG: zinc ribbon domain-containing protein [Thermoplasmata archaeon]
MGFQESFNEFKGSKWVVPAYIVLVIFVVIALAYLNQCLAMILIPVAMFAIPYYMGEKRFRYFALLAVIMIVADSFAFGLLDTNFLSDFEAREQTSPDKITITQGIVNPSLGDPDTMFTFTVNVTANYTNIRTIDFYAYVNISDMAEYKLSRNEPYSMEETDTSDIDATNGKHFIRVIQLPARIHFFHFSANVNGTWNTTLVHDASSNADFSGLGPINADSLAIFQVFFFSALVTLFFTSILFMVIVMMYWWIGKSRIERTKWDTRLREAGELEDADAKIPDFECTNCGRPVHDDAIRCPHCGAIFEEGEEEETEEEPEPEERDP